MACASAGLVANPTWAGTPAARMRSGSRVQSLGGYSSRSITPCPAGLAYTSKTATWAFSTRPAVPVYWRLTPPWRCPSSGRRSRPPPAPPRGHPGARPRRRARHHARRLRPTPPGPAGAPIPSGLASPACSASVQQFLRGRSESSPSTNARARQRGSTRPNRPATRPSSSSRPSCQQAGSTSTLWPAATV